MTSTNEKSLAAVQLLSRTELQRPLYSRPRPSHQSRKAESYNDSCSANKPVSHHLPTDTCKTVSDLAAVVAARPELPEVIRVGILAMVKAAKTERTDQAIGRTGHGEDLAVLLHGMMGGGERPAAGRGLDRDDAQA